MAEPVNKYKSKLLNATAQVTGIVSNTIGDFKAMGDAIDISRSEIGMNILDLAKKNWGAKYNYLVKIDKFSNSGNDIRSPLSDGIIPVYSVQERVPLTRTENIKLPIYGNMRLPVGKDLPSIQLSMYDTEDCIVEKSFRRWSNSIVYGGNSVSPLSEVTSKIQIFKLSYSKKVVMMSSYEVFPDGEVSINMESSNGLKELMVDFSVVYVYPLEDYSL